VTEQPTRESRAHTWQSLQQEQPSRCEALWLAVESAQKPMLRSAHLIGEETQQAHRLFGIGRMQHRNPPHGGNRDERSFDRMRMDVRNDSRRWIQIKCKHVAPLTFCTDRFRPVATRSVLPAERFDGVLDPRLEDESFERHQHVAELLRCEGLAVNNDQRTTDVAVCIRFDAPDKPLFWRDLPAKLSKMRAAIAPRHVYR
jgi:hypothetical protein